MGRCPSHSRPFRQFFTGTHQITSSIKNAAPFAFSGFDLHNDSKPVSGDTPSFLVTSRMGHTQESRSNWLIRQIHSVLLILFSETTTEHDKNYVDISPSVTACSLGAILVSTLTHVLRFLVLDPKTRDILSYFCLSFATKSFFDLFLVLGIITSPIFV